MKFEIYFNGFDENDPQTWDQNRMLVEANDPEIVKAFVKKAFPDTTCGFTEVDTEENGIKLEKPYSANGPFAKREYPCQEWNSAQVPEESESVCYHCGWTKPNHGETNDSVQIWYFSDQNIPEQIKNLSYCGGDEDWVILAPVVKHWEFEQTVERFNRYESNPHVQRVQIDNKEYLLHTVCHA